MPTPYYPSRWFIDSPDSNDDPGIFPYAVGQTFLQKKTPIWSTSVSTSVSGKERRRALFSYPVWNFSVSYEVLRNGPSYMEVQRLYAFFNSMKGKAGEFLFWDRGDNAVTDEIFATGDGTKTLFQATRTIRVGGIYAQEPIFAFNGAPVVTVNGVETAVTVTSRGKIQFASAPAVNAVLSWSGQFLYRCRFENDELDIREMMSGLWEGHGIDFRTTKA